MSARGKHSPPGKGNIYAKANEVIVKITGAEPSAYMAGPIDVVYGG
jgi:hypothetical protein